MIETATLRGTNRENWMSASALAEPDDWPLEEINKPLDSPEEFVKTETGPSLEE